MSTIPQMARRVLRRGRTAKRHGYDLESLHRLRCVVRRLRFALEWLEADTAQLVKVQDALGEACDFGVALHDLGSRRGKRVKHYRASMGRDLRRARQEARAVFLAVHPHVEELASGARDG